MKLIATCFVFAYSVVSLFAGPVFADSEGTSLLEQNIAMNEMLQKIGGHEIKIILANAETMFDRILVDEVVVFSRTTDMIPSGMGVSLFRCDFYLKPENLLPDDLSLVVGLTFNNNIWYLQYCFIMKGNIDDMHIFMLPERNKNWEYIFENREIYYFHERQEY
ncbi:MAG: hypothetical protein A2Z96_05870 [Spirochaetes bacterium GWB1_48_6]|nr:MAG: hypothetical protein A2Z96_05870 [Spirochaetes bacterium GWB1_48_6]